MKIVINTWQDNDYLGHQKMYIDDNHALSVHPLSECPEDAIIGRDLVDCDDVVSLMKKAFEAGANGETLTINYTENKE